MRAEPRPTEVRRIVVEIFGELGAAPASLFDMEERVRVERGRCLARTYRVEGLMAMWLVEVGLVQFYDEDGNMLATVNLLTEFVPPSDGGLIQKSLEAMEGQMRITGNGKLVELDEEEVRAFEEDEAWLRVAEPNPSRGGYAVYAWCLQGEPVFPTGSEKR